MSVKTMTAKGQVTIPKPVRDALHLLAGSKVEFILRENNEVVLRPVTQRVDEIFGRLSRYKKPTPVSIEEMNVATREKMKQHFDEGG